MSQFTMLNRIAAITVSAKQFHWNTRSRCFTWPNGYSKVSIKQIAFFAASFCVANETDISLVLVIHGANVSSHTDGKLHTQSNKSQVLYSSWHSTFTQLRNRSLSTSNSAQLRRVLPQRSMFDILDLTGGTDVIMSDATPGYQHCSIWQQHN